MSSDPGAARIGAVARATDAVDRGRSWLQRRLVWRIWERMLEIEFVDRSVALAGKAFVSFFPLVIVVAAFLPERMRTSVFATMTRRLGVRGDALDLARQAFTSAEDVRRATGVLGLVLTVFFASAFTTALQRVYLRAWRRPHGLKVGAYTRGVAWLIGMMAYLVAVGALARTIGSGAGLVVFVPVAIALSVLWWWFTAWFLLLGHVRWRVLLPGAAITAATMLGYALSASVWMPRTVSENLRQFGFFGIALALITWFSGAAVCMILGACAGPVLAGDPGGIGRLVRGRSDDVLTPGAPPSTEPPERAARLRDAFGSSTEHAAGD